MVKNGKVFRKAVENSHQPTDALLKRAVVTLRKEESAATAKNEQDVVAMFTLNKTSGMTSEIAIIRSQHCVESRPPQAYHVASLRPQMEPTKLSDDDTEGIYKAEVLIHDAKQA
ncbi:hypothetical protein M0R45_026769 [Rubus argutus]|uniref:Uncharacterized protein n=1 Tax=Rubus argutus TaxID=59490 RepID=A0AAW1X101_RUBAR